MLERLPGLEREYELVLAQLADPAVIADRARLRDVSRRHHELEPLVDAVRERREVAGDLEAAREMLTEAVGEERAALRTEMDAIEARLEEIDGAIRVLLVPRDPNDGRNLIVEIRGAEGGEEGNLWARDLHDMYIRFAERIGLAV
ncbi:MAG: PCRF domain-containing protein, partial [Actinomycetota bacterium]|nr:PCRF domain-containing protein [Actinomycetota bacterium]